MHAYPLCVILSGMSDQALDVARRLARARRAYERAFEEFVEVAVEVADANEAAGERKIKQVDLVEASGFTREHIRRLVAKVREERELATAEGRAPWKLTLGGFPKL